MRCVVQTHLASALQGYVVPVPENRTIIVILKNSIGTTWVKEDFSSIEVNGTTYNFDGVTQEDDYTVSLSCVEAVIPEEDPDEEPDEEEPDEEEQP